VIQTGGFRVDEEGNLVEVETREAIPNESDNELSNTRGTVAMALLSGQEGPKLDSATSQWFINVVDNTQEGGPTNLDDQGFTVFGEVTEGLDVVDAIAEVPVTTRNGQASVPETDVVITTIRRR
jgi:cyclophilin family peptidyl-prolyl cis-trans isomerase